MRVHEIKLEIIVKLIQAEIQAGSRSLNRFDDTDQNAIETAEKFADSIIGIISKGELSGRPRIRKPE